MNDDYFLIEPNEPDLVTKRRFPALLQLVILGGLLFILLGATVVPKIFGFFNNENSDAWVDVAAEPSNSATLSTTVPRPINDIQIEAKHAFVYDVLTKKVLYQKDPDVVVPIASITKLMTALVAYELLDDKAAVRVPLSATRQDSASGLMVGERLTSESLIAYAMLASSNDAAHSLATAGGNVLSENQSEAVFVAAMNARAKDLGLFSLEFNNATGLDISSNTAGAYGNARDISFLMEYLLKTYPDLLDTTTNTSQRIYNLTGDFHEATNTNRALSKIPSLLGSKTGFTYLAGGNLVVAFDAGINRPIIITVLGSSFSGRFDDVIALSEASRQAVSEVPEI